MSYDSMRNPEKYGASPMPSRAGWKAADAMGSGICRRCEDDEHAACLDMTEEHNECSCATKGHVLTPTPAQMLQAKLGHEIAHEEARKPDSMKGGK